MRVFLLICFSLLISNCYAQQREASLVENYEGIYQFTKEKYQADQQLINGSYHEYKYLHAKGHPFIFENEFIQGDLVFHGTDYTDVFLKYDIYEQILIVYSSQDSYQVSIQIPIEFITEFTFNDMHFKKHTFNMEAPKYYQHVANTDQISCLYYWYKNRQESTHMKTFISYEFSKDKHKSYLLFNEQLSQFKNKRSYVNIFPEAIQKDLMSYLKTQKLKFRKISDEEMSQIVQYSQVLLEQNTNPKLSL